MIRIIKFILPILILSSCAINQDYYFEKNGSVKMDVGIDMSQLIAQMPKKDEFSAMDFSNMKDSLNANGTIDSLKQNGVSEVNFSFDTNTNIMKFDMFFDNMKSFSNYMNHDRDEKLKPIEVVFSKKSFGVKNCSSLISKDMLDAFNKGGDETTEGMDMDNFFKFNTTYHFPYEVDTYKSESGKGMLSEDKKSITFDNTMSEISDSKYNGDITVKFK